MLKLTTVRERVAELARRDPELTVFGAERHRYNLTPPLSPTELTAVERRLGLTLPEDYGRFVAEVADGGAGPGYGLEPLRRLLRIEAVQTPLEVDEPFPLTSAILGPDELEAHVGPPVDSGVIPLGEYGCGIQPHLVVRGAEAGHVWVLDLVNDGGVYPFSDLEAGHLHDPSKPFPETVEEMVFADRLSFSDWYEDWLAAAERQLGVAQ